MEKLRAWMLLLLAAYPLSVLASDSTLPVESQLRLEGEDSREALERYYERAEAEGVEVAPREQSAQGSAVRPDELDIRGAPSVESLERLTQGFERARDERWIRDPEVAGVLRRPSWLYPDDGCFARASLATRKLKEWGFVQPMKLFIFGNLRVRTPNAPGGTVRWWYHVVPALAQQGALYVLDPAIDPERPLPWMDWIATMTSDARQVRVSLCASPAYGPGSACRSPGAGNDSGAPVAQALYLRLERARLARLGRDPRAELGDSPPWAAFTGLLAGP